MTLTSAMNIDAIVEGAIQQTYLSKSLTLPTPEVIELIIQLTEFELGEKMIISCGLNSSLVDYMCHHDKSSTGHPLENWLLSKAPRITATKERYKITQSILQSELRSNMTIGIMPCRVISKIAELDYSHVKNVNIVGYNRDVAGLVKSEQQMEPLVRQGKVNLYLLKQNLWLLDDQNQHDLILSSKLIALEEDDHKISKLLRKFYAALKRDGILISSFFTPSPLTAAERSPWKDVYADDLLKEHCIFSDILDFHPPERTKEQMCNLMQEAGFEIVGVYPDKLGIYPTIKAKKA